MFESTLFCASKSEDIWWIEVGREEDMHGIMCIAVGGIRQFYQNDAVYTPDLRR